MMAHYAVIAMYILLVLLAIVSPRLNKIVVISSALVLSLTPLFISPLEYQNRIERAIYGIAAVFYSLRLSELVCCSETLALQQGSVTGRLLHIFGYFHSRSLQSWHLVHMKCAVDTPKSDIIADQIAFILPRLVVKIAILSIVRSLVKSFNGSIFAIPSLYLSMVVYLYCFLPLIEYCMRLALLTFGVFVPTTVSVQNDILFYFDDSDVSLAVFWSKRWNQVVQKDVLRRYVYFPVYNVTQACGGISQIQSKFMASFATFLISGIWHAWPVLLAHGHIPHWDMYCNGEIKSPLNNRGLWMAASMFSFFIVQWLLIVVEHQIFTVRQATPSTQVYKLQIQRIEVNGDLASEIVKSQDTIQSKQAIAMSKSKSLHFQHKLFVYAAVLLTSPLLIAPILSILE
ncbi:hypothetical protein MP228_010218 [Amoeboaphelidium protococcarum]|nr:hypothetical protein MP228_010218 [Amoeboaphelidium protococcarum]